jgi:hypothetical protein
MPTNGKLAKNLAILAVDETSTVVRLPLLILYGDKLYRLMTTTRRRRLVLVREPVTQAPETKDLTLAGVGADTTRQ